MDREQFSRFFWWFCLGLLIALLAGLGALQYRWIGEVSASERKKLREDLQLQLANLARDFDVEINDAAQALLPTDEDVEQFGLGHAVAQRYQTSPITQQLFVRIGLIEEGDGDPRLVLFDPEVQEFKSAPWPPEWEQLRARGWGQQPFPGPPGTNGRPDGRIPALASGNLVLLPKRDPPPPGQTLSRLRQEWFVAEVNLAHVADVLLPKLLRRHLGRDYRSVYVVNVVSRPNDHLIYPRDTGGTSRIGRGADTSFGLFEVLPQIRGKGSFRPRMHGEPMPLDAARGRWEIRVRPLAGSLDMIVSRIRSRNLAVSGGILLLLSTTCLALFRFSRQTHRLASMEMQFVANVSHELRTPLTVIRTAAFNLQRKAGDNSEQVKTYASLIQDESEKLTAIIDQVLHFAGTQAGHAVRERNPVPIESLIDSVLEDSAPLLREADCTVDKRIAPSIPSISGDPLALKYALQNLISNAIKYGIAREKWIGLSAQMASVGGKKVLEIKVADHGEGIPADEQKYIFDPFFRGSKAIREQIHGTGLGLSLVKKIVEAHGGTVLLDSQPGQGSAFTLRIPFANAESV